MRMTGRESSICLRRNRRSAMLLRNRRLNMFSSERFDFQMLIAAPTLLLTGTRFSGHFTQVWPNIVNQRLRLAHFRQPPETREKPVKPRMSTVLANVLADFCERGKVYCGNDFA